MAEDDIKIIVEKNGEQREIKVKWNSKIEKELESVYRLDIEIEIAKLLGLEIVETIRDWKS